MVAWFFPNRRAIEQVENVDFELIDTWTAPKSRRVSQVLWSSMALLLWTM